MLKKLKLLLAICAIVLATWGVLPASAKTLGYGYFDGIRSSISTLTLTATTVVTSSALTVTDAFKPAVKTKAQMSAMTGVVGAVYLCSDCTIPYSVCVGTGTTISGWKVSHSATVGCGVNN